MSTSSFARKPLRAAAAAAIVAGLVALIIPSEAVAAPGDVGLGTAASFGVLAGQGVTNTGPTNVGADLGTCPNPAISGFPPGTVGGTIHANDAVACQAQSDLTTAYNDAAGRAATTTYGGPTDLGGDTLVAGVYQSPTSFAITGTVTLDGQNDPDSVFIFQAGSTLITATDSSVALINGAQACNVFWQVGSSATLGVDSTFTGTIMALSAIAANTNAVIDGRLLARNASVTLDTNQIRPAVCAATTPTSTSSTVPTTPTSTSSTVPGGPTSTPTTAAPAVTTTPAPSDSGSQSTTPTQTNGGVTTATTRPAITVTSLPRTGMRPWQPTIGLLSLALGVCLSIISRPQTASRARRFATKS